MEKEISYTEAIHLLGEKTAIKSRELSMKYGDFSHGGRDGGSTQEQRKLTAENGRRFFKLKEIFADNKALPESEVMKIIMGDF